MTSLSVSPTRASDWPERLIGVLERQKAMIDELVALAQAQAGLIAERHTDRLLELLARRQSIIDEFKAAQGEMSHLTHDLDERLAGAAAPVRERIRALLSGIGHSLRDVMRHDQEDQARLRVGRDAVLQEMTSMDAGRHARHAYAPTSVNGNRFADRRG